MNQDWQQLLRAGLHGARLTKARLAKGKGAAGESACRGRADLVFLPDPNGIHPGMPGAAHDIAQIFILCNLVRCHAHLGTEYDDR